MVVGRDGCTTIHSRSSGLSSQEDRARFHELRKRADVILIGGNTARHEPYAKTPVPLVVLTQGELPLSIATNTQARAVNLSLEEALTVLSGCILIEAGPSIISQGLRSKLIDEFHLTRADIESGENCLDLEELTSGYIEVGYEKVGSDIFQIYKPVNTLR